MRKNVNIGNWRLAWMENAAVRDNAVEFKCAADIEKGGCRVIEATVPGSYEIDFMREGLLDDLYMGTNIVQTQRMENLHLYYFTEFTYTAEEGCDANLCFKGIDTVEQPFEKLTTDVTQFNVCGEKVYLSPTLDLYNREIVSYSISLSPNLEQIREMLNGLLRNYLKMQDRYFIRIKVGNTNTLNTKDC